MSTADKSASGASDPVFLWPEFDNFSLVLGGPLYQLLRKARLEERVEDHLLWRVVVIIGIIWLPLTLIPLEELLDRVIVAVF